jgi:hypothetical protein
MPSRLLYINVLGNKILVETSGVLKKTIQVKHNDIVVAEQESWFNPGTYIIDVVENGEPVHYRITAIRGGRYTGGHYRVVRNGVTMLLI